MSKSHPTSNRSTYGERAPEAELAERNRVLQALNDLASHLLRINTADEVYEVAIDGVLGIVGSSRGAIALADDAHREFRLATFRGYNEESRRATDHLSYDIPTAHGTARANRDILVIHPEQQFQVAQQVLQGELVQTAVLLPLFEGSEVTGVLSYLLPERRECTPLELEMLRTASTYVTAALQRAKLYETVEAERARLEYILEQLPVGVFIAEGNGTERTARITLTNRLGHAQTRASTSTPGPEREIAAFLRADGSPCPEEERPLQRALWTGKPISQEEIVFRYTNGEERTFLVSTGILRDLEGQREVVAVRQDITERRRLEEQVRVQAEAVRTQYERLATLVDNVDIALTMLDADGRLTMVNDAALHRVGLSREQVVGHRYEDMGPGSADQPLIAMRDRVLATGQPVLLHDVFVKTAAHPEGIYIDWSVLPVRDTGGKVTGLLTVSIDVTEKMRARQEIEKQRALLESVLESAPVGIIVFDSSMQITNVNAEYARMSGMDPVTSTGRNFYEAFPLTRDRQAIHNRALDGEELEPENVSLVPTVDNEPHTYDVRYRRMVDSEGRVTGLLSTALDITDKMHARQQAESQRALLETIIDSAPVGLVLYDRDMTIARCNAEFTRLTGITAADAPGNTRYNFVAEAADHATLRDRVLGGESLDLDSVSHPEPQDGKTRYLDVRYRPVLDGETVAWVLCAVVDVTEREAINRQKDEFIALASHELKTPVTAIKGYAQMGLLTAEKSDNEKLVRTLRVIDTQANRLTRLINELLDVALVEERQSQLSLEEFDLSKLVQEVSGNLQLTAPNFQVDVELPDQPLPVTADRQRIEQVLTNLAHNAIKYSGHSRRIGIKLENLGKEAVVAITDYGVGIPEEQQERIFERFFRASNVSSANYSGLGLGLFISRDIISRHDGRLWLESAVGRGSTFYFSLPTGL